MSTVKEFTPVLMYVDHERIDTLMKSAKEFEDKINSKFREVEKFLDQKLSDDQLFNLATRGILFVDELLSESFQFKNATKDFNLEALGLTESYKDLEISLRSSTTWITAYDYAIEKGAAILSEKGKNTIVEAHTHYTKNEAQSDALKLSEKIINDLNTAISKEWIVRYDFESIKRGIKIINEVSGKFIPNYRNISSMNDQGRIMSNW